MPLGGDLMMVKLRLGDGLRMRRGAAGTGRAPIDEVREPTTTIKAASARVDALSGAFALMVARDVCASIDAVSRCCKEGGCITVEACEV